MSDLNLSRIRRDIEGASEDARFLAFLSLYQSKDPMAAAEVARILQAQDPILKLMFLRFLSHIPEERAIRDICRLIDDPNLVVAEAAERAFERNSCDGKLKLLVPLMRSSHRKAQAYAIGRVSQSGWIDAVSILLGLMPGADRSSPGFAGTRSKLAEFAESDEELMLVILSALRLLPCDRIVDPVLQLLGSEQDEIRFRAVLVLGAVYERDQRRLRRTFLAVLSDSANSASLLRVPAKPGLDGDPSPRVRQAAVWALRRRPRRRNLSLLMRLSSSDPDPLVRQEALNELGLFPTATVIRYLLHVLVSEGHKLVALKAESVLLNMEATRLVRALMRIVKSSAAGPERNKAILLAAEFQKGSAAYYDFLLKGLRRAASDRDRVVFIEALGIFGDRRAVEILMPFLRQSPLLAYVAMAALLKTGGEDWPLLEYLEDPAGSLLLKQMVLRYLSRKDTITTPDRDRLVRCLLEFLQGDNINMRYLAAQVLVRIAGPTAQEALLRAVQKEEDPASLKLLSDSLLGFFTANPAGYVTFLHLKRGDAAEFSTLCEMLKHLIWSASEITAQLPRLFAPDMVASGDYYMDCGVAWLGDQIIQGRVALDQVVRALEETSVIDVVLGRVADRLDQLPDLVLPMSAEMLRRRMDDGSAREREAIIRLMGISRNPSVIPVLVSVVCSDRWGDFCGLAARSLAQITRETT